MARLRFMAVALLALAFAGNSTQTGRTQCQTTVRHEPSCSICVPTKPVADDSPCVMYSLTDMGYDANLGKWIAETIPEMIEPNSWQPQGGSGVLRYYAPKNILMVKQSKSIQSKVDSFLKDLKASMPKASAANSAGKQASTVGVVPADYREPALLRTANPVSEAQPYPVPAAVKPPKHLFHFIIRYEGEGIIDDNVVKFMKWQAQSEKPAAAAPAPVCQPYALAPTSGATTPPTPSTPVYSAPANVDATPTPTVNPPERISKSAKKKKGKKDDSREKTGEGTTTY